MGSWSHFLLLKNGEDSPDPLEVAPVGWTVLAKAMGALLDFALLAPALLALPPYHTFPGIPPGCSENPTHTRVQLGSSQMERQAMPQHSPLSNHRPEFACFPRRIDFIMNTV